MKKFYNYLITSLTSKWGRAISFGLSHGMTHFIVLLIATGTAVFFYCKSKANSGPVAHQIMLRVDNSNLTSVQEDDTINAVYIDIILNSDSTIKRTKGKANSQINITYDTQRSDSVAGMDVHLSWKPYREPLSISREEMSLEMITTDSIVQTDNSPVDIQKTEGWDTTKYQSEFKVLQRNDSMVSVHMVPCANAKSPWGDLFCGPQHLRFESNDFAPKKDNPYYYYYIGIDLPYSRQGNTLSFRLGDDTKVSNQLYPFQNRDLRYTFIHPVPDIIHGAWIYYYTKEKMAEISLNHGIVIQAEDIAALNRSNHDAFFYSIIVGLLVAFILDVLIQLVREWRDLNKRNDKSKAPKNIDSSCQS